MKIIKKYIHRDYVVDNSFSRTGEKRNIYLVSELSELEAKDLVCNLMDCVEELLEMRRQIELIAEKYNFQS